MRRVLAFLIFGFFCTIVGIFVGVWFGPSIKMTPFGRVIVCTLNKVPLTTGNAAVEKNTPIEVYDYPTIKWHAKPLAQPDGAIAQLWTTFEWNSAHTAGKMNYRLTVFKAGDREKFEVQLLDDNGFKISQFDATDFRQVPGAADIKEARDSTACSEDDYKKVGDYVVN